MVAEQERDAVVIPAQPRIALPAHARGIDLKTQKYYLKIFIGAMGLVVLIWYGAGMFIGDKSKINKVLKTAVNGVENKDPLEFLSVFAKTYQDDMGFSKMLIMEFTHRAFKAFEDIDVDLSNVKIEIDGKRALVTLNIWGEATRVSTMGAGKNPLRESFEQRGSQINFSKESGSWKIVSSKKIAFGSKVIF